MVAATTSSSAKSAAASSGQKADQDDEKLTPVEAAAEKMMGADVGEEGEHAEEAEDEETVGFEGWARVFFQARNDRSAQQILPTNSSTLARESHLFVVVDPKATELRLYPDDKDLRLIVDPPIELKYFYAVSVPGSEAGAALFLKEDDRQLRRYIFRFEFRNDSVLQPSSRPQSLSLSARVAKYAQRSSNLKQVEIKAKAFSNQEDASDMQRAEEAKSQEAHLAYLNTTSDMIGDATTAADTFIALINAPSEQDTEDATWKRRPKRSWGPGYEDVKSVGRDQDAGSDYSSSDFESLDDDDEDEEEDVAALIEDEEATVLASGGGRGGGAAACGDTGKVASSAADGGGRRGKFQNETLEQSFRRLRA